MPRQRFDWRPPLYTAVLATIVFVPITFVSRFDFAEVGYLLFIAPVVAVVLLIRALLRNRLTRFGTLLSYCVVTLIMVKSTIFWRAHGRWLLFGGEYKRAVLAQPQPLAGDLRHLEWDDWGLAGSGTSAYLVFDPEDTLISRLRESKDGRINQYLCGASAINRLQAKWYSVVFYTNQFWEACT